MAKTLRWPKSLNKQVINIEQLKTKNRMNPFKILIAGLLIGLSLFLIVNHYFYMTTAIELFVTLSWISILAIISFGYRFFSNNIETDKRLKGLNGELIVAYKLDELPDDWFIINDIVIAGSQIDHIAVGPTGIFCLETKNWNNAACDANGIWYRFHLGQWVPIVESPVLQNLNHVLLLRKFLDEMIGLNETVVSVVVLANPNGKFNIRSRFVPPGNTMICLPGELSQLLLGNRSTVLLAGEVQKIARNLAGNNKKANIDRQMNGDNPKETL